MAIEKAAVNAGQKIVKFMVQELTAAGVWPKWGEDEREDFLGSADEAIRAAVCEGYVETIANGLPAVKASLGNVTVNGSKVSAKVNFDVLESKDLHRVVDFAGRGVMITLADNVDDALDGMQELIDTTREHQLEFGLEETLEASRENLTGGKLFLDNLPGDLAGALDEFADSGCTSCGGLGHITGGMGDNLSSWVCPCTVPLVRSRLEEQDKPEEADQEEPRASGEPVDLKQLADPECSLCMGQGYTVGEYGENPQRCACTDDNDWPADPNCDHCGGKGFKEVPGHGMIECICTTPRDQSEGEVEERDSLYHRALNLVVSTQKVNVTALQKELGVGRDKVQEVLGELEEAGVVSAPDGRNRRTVVMGQPDEDPDEPEGDLDLDEEAEPDLDEDQEYYGEDDEVPV